MTLCPLWLDDFSLLLEYRPQQNTAVSAAKLGYRQLIDYSKLPIEISSSGILVRRAYVIKVPDLTFRFLKGWIEGTTC